MVKTRVGIFSPSNNLLKVYPNRCKTGIDNLKKIGFEVVFSTNYDRYNDYTKASVKERVKEIDELIKEKNIRFLISSIGGYVSIQILDYLDYDYIKKNNIIFCGSSDITILLLAIYYKTGNIMLYGPTYTVDLCNYEGIDNYTKDNLLLCYNKEPHKLLPSEVEVCEYIDWGELENKKRKRKVRKKENDWHIIKNGEANGKLIGGNLASILLLLNTKYLDASIFKDSILFLEDCETNILELCSYFESLKINNIFSLIKGLVIGKFDSSDLNTNIDAFLTDYFSEYSFPIISNVDFGHISPVATIPIGALSTLKCDKNKIDFEIISY